ncbi:MAG: hypothetical protein ABL962_13135, partial [Fimbriimonadaceae bacterium]
KWTERPPYKFIEGAHLYFIEVRNGQAELIFTSSRSCSDLYREAIFEVRGVEGHMEDGDDFSLSFSGSGRDGKPDYNLGLEDTRRAWLGFAGLYHPGIEVPALPVWASSIIHVRRPPTLLDRVRGWLYGVQWKGSGP